MREIRLYGSEGGGAVRSPYPYQTSRRDPLDSRFRGNDEKPSLDLFDSVGPRLECGRMTT